MASPKVLVDDQFADADDASDDNRTMRAANEARTTAASSRRASDPVIDASGNSTSGKNLSRTWSSPSRNATANVAAVGASSMWDGLRSRFFKVSDGIVPPLPSHPHVPPPPLAPLGGEQAKLIKSPNSESRQTSVNNVKMAPSKAPPPLAATVGPHPVQQNPKALLGDKPATAKAPTGPKPRRSNNALSSPPSPYSPSVPTNHNPKPAARGPPQSKMTRPLSDMAEEHLQMEVRPSFKSERSHAADTAGAGSAHKRSRPSSKYAAYTKPPKMLPVGRKPQRVSLRALKRSYYAHQNPRLSAPLAKPPPPQPIPRTHVTPIRNCETQVWKAARIIGEELLSGMWPEVREGAHAAAAVALEQFAKEIFLPTLLCGPTLDEQDPEVDGERGFLATVLALREVLTQNAEKIFRMDDVADDGSELMGTTPPPGHQRWKNECRKEEKMHVAQLYATGIVFAALDRLGEPASTLYSSQLTRLITCYDAADDEFASCLEPASEDTLGITPDGKSFGWEENVAWKVSYNCAREQHPLITKNLDRKLTDRKKLLNMPAESPPHRISVPAPTACLVTVVEALPTWITRAGEEV